MRDYSKNKWWKGQIWTAYTRDNIVYVPPKTSITACILLLCISGIIGICLNLWVEFWDTYALAQVEVPAKVDFIDINSLPVVEQIMYYSEREHFNRPELLVSLAKCESSLRPDAVGDGGDSRGLYQINKRFHSVPDSEAFDIEKSTLWTINQIKQGKLYLWTCASKI